MEMSLHGTEMWEGPVGPWLRKVGTMVLKDYHEKYKHQYCKS